MNKLLYIVWNKEKELGIPIIDEQHRGIISNINTLHYFIRHGRGDEAAKPVLIMLEQYTDIHFQTEEDLMKRHGFPHTGDHIKLHKYLMNRTKGLSVKPESMRDPDEVLKFLREWWLNHINIEDQKYVPYIDSKTREFDV